MSPTQTTESHEHLPTALNPQDLSRSASPQQSNLSLLASISILPSPRVSERVNRYPTDMLPFAPPRPA